VLLVDYDQPSRWNVTDSWINAWVPTTMRAHRPQFAAAPPPSRRPHAAQQHLGPDRQRLEQPRQRVAPCCSANSFRGRHDAA